MAKKKQEEERNPRQLMRIEFPSPLKSGDQEFGGIEFIGYLINTQPQFSMDRPGLASAMRLEVALREKTNAMPLYVEWRDLQLLRESAEKPRNGYPIQPARVVLPFLTAMDAEEEYNPEPPSDEEAEEALKGANGSN